MLQVFNATVFVLKVIANYKVELFSFHRMSEKKNLSIERKLTNQTVIAMFIFCLSTIHNAIGQYPPCSACQLELETRVHAKVHSLLLGEIGYYRVNQKKGDLKKHGHNYSEIYQKGKKLVCFGKFSLNAAG